MIRMLTLSILPLFLCVLSALGIDVASGDAAKILLTSRKVPKGHVAGLHRRSLAAFNIPLVDQFNGTDLQ